jgi:hypothetical protein
MPLKPKLVPATISEVTGVDNSVVGADGDEAKVAVAYGKKEDGADIVATMLPLIDSQISTIPPPPTIACANKGPAKF